jgi:PhoPQ-activated pathogenicity-related protein
MSSKDRSEYNTFKKGKMEPQVKKLMPMGIPMGLPMGNPMMFAQHQMPMGYGGMMMNRPPYGPSSQQYN